MWYPALSQLALWCEMCEEGVGATPGLVMWYPALSQLALWCEMCEEGVGATPGLVMWYPALSQLALWCEMCGCHPWPGHVVSCTVTAGFVV